MPRDQRVERGARAPRPRRSQAWPSQPPAPSAAATKSADAVETVGLAELIRSVKLPGLSPQAASTTSRRHRRHRCARIACAHRGCGSSATTRAPSRRKLPMRSPTWLPMSKARSPGLQKAPVERVHRRIARSIAVVDIQGAAQRGERRIGFGRAMSGSKDHRSALALSSQVTARAAVISGGGAKSSGMPQMPRRCRRRRQPALPSRQRRESPAGSRR